MFLSPGLSIHPAELVRPRETGLTGEGVAAVWSCFPNLLKLRASELIPFLPPNLASALSPLPVHSYKAYPEDSSRALFPPWETPRLTHPHSPPPLRLRVLTGEHCLAEGLG